MSIEGASGNAGSLRNRVKGAGMQTGVCGKFEGGLKGPLPGPGDLRVVALLFRWCHRSPVYRTDLLRIELSSPIVQKRTI